MHHLLSRDTITCFYTYSIDLSIINFSRSARLNFEIFLQPVVKSLLHIKFCIFMSHNNFIYILPCNQTVSPQNCSIYRKHFHSRHSHWRFDRCLQMKCNNQVKRTKGIKFWVCWIFHLLVISSKLTAKVIETFYCFISFLNPQQYTQTL